MARILLQVNDTTNGTATVPPEYTPNGTPQDVTPCQLYELQDILRGMKPYDHWNTQIADVHKACPDTFMFGGTPDSESTRKLAVIPSNLVTHTRKMGRKASLLSSPNWTT